LTIFQHVTEDRLEHRQ